MNAETLSQSPQILIEIITKLQSELNTSQKRCEEYARAYDVLQHQVKELLRHRFGKKSERFMDDNNPQLSLFGDLSRLSSTLDETNEKDEIHVKSYSRTKKGKKEKDIPKRIEIIPVSEEQKQCSCGSCKTVIRYETKYLIHRQPEIYEIIEQRREVVACPKGCDHSVLTAPAPLQLLPKIKATEEFLSFLIVSKLDDRQPLYHLEKQLSDRYGIDCSRQTMARWIIELMMPLRPIFNLFKDQIIDYDVASCDATSLQVLQEVDRRAETKSYVYCMRGGPPDKGVILYAYNDRLHKQFVKDWFCGFKGYLHVDGDNFFALIGEIAKLVNCHAHARRKYEAIAQETKGKALAKEVLRFYKELYKIEREAKNKQMTTIQRYELRQQQSKPLLDKFKQWLDKHYPIVLPQSPLGQGIQYCLKLWDGLTRYLEDGRLEIDNNHTEREIKPFVIARKNFLFSASVDGANALCMHFSLIRTAKLHGIDPYHYYVKLLKSIPYCRTVEDYENLLPWNIKLEHIRNC